VALALATFAQGAPPTLDARRLTPTPSPAPRRRPPGSGRR
jgi:hypothetical protein